MNEFTHIDLFSGIGGFSLAAESVGFRTILFCEIDEFCQKVLGERFGGVVADPESLRELQPKRGKQDLRGRISNSNIPIIPDIRDVDGTKFRGATLLTGGFPCQPFSVAGQRRGKNDDRFLWPEMLRIIKEARPRWICGENVAGIIPMALDKVLTDLESEGYSARPVVIPACAKNPPHRRDRVWIIAKCRDDRYPNEINVQGIRKEQSRLVSLGLQSGKNETWEENWLEVATRFCRVDDGLPSWIYSNRVKRLKALGNAIVPQIAQEILRCIYETEKADSCEAGQGK